MEELNFAGYPSAYKTAAEKLVVNLLKKQKFSEQKEIFNSFCKHYSVVPILWKAWIGIEHNGTCNGVAGDQIYNYECTKRMTKLYHESVKPFYVDIEAFEKHQHIRDRPYRKLLTFPDFDKIHDFIDIHRLRYVVLLEQALKIPHSKLHEVFKMYESRCDAPLNKEVLKQHENAKTLYAKIMAAKTDNEWLNLLLESKDDEFIVENIEYKLSENPLNKEIWKFYFDYFANESDIRLLNLYRRHGRLFIEDSETRKLYAKRIEYFQKDGYDVEIWINDLKDFHEYFEITTETYSMPKMSDMPPTKTIMESKRITVDSYDEILFGDEIIYKKCNAFFNPVNIFLQDFSLPKTLMFYITQNYSIKSYRKLIQTCKYIFIQRQIIPVWHFNASKFNFEDYFHQNSMYLGCIDENVELNGEIKPPITLNHEIWLEKSVVVNGEFKFLNKVYQSDIQFLHLTAADIAFKEYEMLVKSEKIQEILLSNMKIITESEKEISLEELMKWLPNAFKISFFLKSILITPVTSHILSVSKRNVKIKNFCIDKITEEFEPNAFCKFLRNNITSTSYFSISYSSPINENYQNTMKAAVEKIVSDFQENGVPNVKLYY